MSIIAAEGKHPAGERGVDSGRKSDKPTVLLSRTTANQNTRNALRSLVEHDMLAEFWTTFVWDPQSMWNAVLPAGLRSQLARRSITEAPAHLVRSCPWREVVRLGARGTPLDSLLCSDQRPFSIAAMGASFDARVARRIQQLRPDIVYAYEDGGLQTYRAAKRMGVTVIHEQPSGYWRWTGDLFAEEAELSPEFASLLPSTKYSTMEVERKEEELKLADYVVVPSQHVLSSLAGVVPKDRIRMIPYGAPEVRPRRRLESDSSAPLKVLFVGNLIQRKGIRYLLEAMELLGGKAELTMVGRRLGPNAKVDEGCRRWRWIETLPHDRVMELMQESDVLVLPSLTDAFGLVITEALACGLPVIVTPNTGGSEIVRDGREGYVVPIRRADILADRLEGLSSDRELLAEMSRQAQETAARNSWQHYRADWARMVRSLACC